jgi:hypothetical protein
MEQHKQKVEAQADGSSRAGLGLETEKTLLLKIDLNLMPLLFCSYFLQFLDKVVYNVSSVSSIWLLLAD